MADKMAEAEAKALWPNSPCMWPSLVPAQELSTDPRVRAAQSRYPNSPSWSWGEPFDHDKEYAKLEAEAAGIAAAYPNSVAPMMAAKVGAAVSIVDENLRLLEAELAAAAPPAAGE